MVAKIREKKIQQIRLFFLHFFLPASVLIGIVTYIVYSHEIDREIMAVKNVESEILDLNERYMSENLQIVISDLHILAGNAHLIEYVNGIGPGKGPLEKDLILFSRVRGLYDQIRFLDHQGMEQVRINNDTDGPYNVPEHKLQLKKERYYFKDIFKMDPGQVFVSPLDLNIEHGAIEIPIKPMIRFGTPVVNTEGEKKGVIILNYYGQRLLEDITTVGEKIAGQIMLVNSQGYYLRGGAPQDEWGFMYPHRKNRRFDLSHGKAWEDIVRKHRGQMFHDGSLYTYATVYPVPENSGSSSGSPHAFEASAYPLTGKDYAWKLISLIPSTSFDDIRLSILKKLMGIVLPVLMIVLLGAWCLTVFRFRRMQAERRLHDMNVNLEHTVARRTDALNRLNLELKVKVTELKETRDGILERERYYRSLIDHIQEDILVIDPNYNVSDVNETFLERMGLERYQVVGKKCYDVSHEENKPCMKNGVACPHHKVFTTGESVWDIYKHQGGIGGEFWVENVFSPLRNSKGDITHVIKVSRDISEERRLENQLRQSQKMEAIGHLAGGIAHDFNNILFPILGYAEMARDDIAPKETRAKGYLQEIINGVHRAKNLVSQILTFSYRTEKEMKPLDVGLVVKEALKLLISTIPATIEIRREIEKAGTFILCDATQVHQIVMNLCTNAYHAMEGEPGQIHVSVKREVLSGKDISDEDQKPGPYVCLSIRDTGKSIEKGHMDRIFEPYFTTKEKGKGTGLGLSVVHSIVRSYGGHITVSSEKNHGTCFSVYFPAVNQDNEKSLTQKKKLEVKTPTKGEHLMLVDDDRAILELEKKALSRLGYRISSYLSSVEAFQAFKESPQDYDMVITDFTMPTLTGEDLARKINHMKKDTPIILLTGYSSTINPDNAKKIGIKAYVSKPVVLSQLSQTIRQVLDGYEGYLQG